MAAFDISTTIDRAVWDTYVENHGNDLYAHRYAWSDTLAKRYQLSLFHLALVNCDNERLAGVLPLMKFCPPQGAQRLISLPYTDSAGIVSDDDSCARLLMKGALELADELNVQHLELRQLGAQPAAVDLAGVADGWYHRPYDFKTGLVRELPQTSDELWRMVGAKVRNQVRKARKSGCTVRFGGAEFLDDFYRVFSENMRDLGSPVHSPELFSRLFAEMADHVTVFVVDQADQPVAAAILIRHRTTVTNPWASSLRRFRPLCPNMLLYWSMLERGVSSGCRKFDFGRSTPDATTCRFKEQWGAERVPLIWHVFSKGERLWDPRMESLEDDGWKHIDLETSRQKGPALRRWISL